MATIFIYKFDYIPFGPPIPVDVTHDLPIVNNNNSFIINSLTQILVGQTYTITVDFTFNDTNTNDGLSFINSQMFYSSFEFSNLTITQFGGIPLSRGGSQFGLIQTSMFQMPLINISTNTDIYRLV